MREPADADPPFRDWLLAHRQTERTIDRFWGLVLVSALNETVDRIGLRYARKVFRDGFLEPSARVRGLGADRAARPVLRR